MKTHQKLQLSAAVLLMLAGCGGSGGSGDGASTSSGLNETKDAASAAASPTSDQRVNDDAAPSGTLSADLLATVLADSTTIPANASTRMPFYVNAQPSSGPMPGGETVVGADWPDIAIDQSTGHPWNSQGALPGPKTFNLGVRVVHAQQRDAFDLNEVRLSFSLSGAKEEVDAKANAPAGTELLRIDPLMQADGPISTHKTEITRLMNAAQPLLLRKGEEVPRNRVLQHWETQEGGNQFAQLMVLDGETDNQFRVCLNAHALNAKRLTCSIWNVPEGWTIGQDLEFKGYYVVDDRSVFGAEGHLYWRTAEAGAGQAAEAPISAQGISGGVLATMWDSWMPTNLQPDRELETRYASAVDANGNRITPVAGQYSATLTSYSHDAGANPDQDQSTYQPVVGAASVKLTSSAYSGPIHFESPDLPSFKRLQLEFNTTDSYVNDKAPARFLDEALQVGIGSAEPVRMLASGPRHFGLDRLVPFGTLNQWQTRFGDSSNVVTMEVLPGKQPDEAKLCWKVALTELQRTICTSYRIPANWQRGQQLQVVGQHVEAPGPQYWGTGSF